MLGISRSNTGCQVAEERWLLHSQHLAGQTCQDTGLTWNGVDGDYLPFWVCHSVNKERAELHCSPLLPGDDGHGSTGGHTHGMSDGGGCWSHPRVGGYFLL